MLTVRGRFPVHTCFTCISVAVLLRTVVVQDGSFSKLKDAPFLSCSSPRQVLKVCCAPMLAMAAFLAACAIACWAGGSLDVSTMGSWPLVCTNQVISHKPSFTSGS